MGRFDEAVGLQPLNASPAPARPVVFMNSRLFICRESNQIWTEDKNTIFLTTAARISPWLSYYLWWGLDYGMEELVEGADEGDAGAEARV